MVPSADGLRFRLLEPHTAGCQRGAVPAPLSTYSREGATAPATAKNGLKRASLREATRAWFEGEFARCLEQCEAVKPRDAQTRIHVALLQARALLRLDRAADALRVLRDASTIPMATDEACSLLMLTGAARVRCGAYAEGLALLAQARAGAAHAHATIRSEIALHAGLGEFFRRNFDAAERELRKVDPAADIIYARALECLAWTAVARGASERATSLFVEALDALARCEHHDRSLEANCVRALAHLALERLDVAAWSVVADRRTRIAWDAGDLGDAAFWLAYCASSYALDVEGDAQAAAREARVAEQVASSDAYRAQALCKRAAVMRAVNEPVAHRDHVDHAAELFDASSGTASHADETSSALLLAEQLAYAGRIGDAERCVAAYRARWSGTAALPPWLAPTAGALEKLVAGVVAEHAGDRDAALVRYREAYDAYVGVGYVRRAVDAALHITALSYDARLHGRADRMTAHLPAESLLRRRLNDAKPAHPPLTNIQREVLALIAQGKSNPEIARLRGRSLHTIRNLIARLFEVLHVSSREELAIEGVRLGLYTPPRRSRAS